MIVMYDDVYDCDYFESMMTIMNDSEHDGYS